MLETVCAWWLWGESWSWSWSSCGLGGFSWAHWKLPPCQSWAEARWARAEGMASPGMRSKPLPWQRVEAEVESDVGWGLCWSSLGGPAEGQTLFTWQPPCGTEDSLVVHIPLQVCLLQPLVILVENPAGFHA